jgi:hypothetical protein
VKHGFCLLGVEFSVQVHPCGCRITRR